MESKISSGDQAMKRIFLLLTVTMVFILSGSAAWAASNAGKGKPDTPGGQKAAAKDTAEEKTETSKTERQTRTVTTRDPRTGETVTREVPIEGSQNAKDRPTRSVTTRDPRTGQTITRQIPVTEEQAAELEEKTKAAKEKAGKEAKAAKEKTEDEAGDDAEKAAGQAKGKEKSAQAKGKPEGTGLGKDQKAAALAKQMQHEDQKHAARQARLAEMLKVAQNKGDDKAIGRIQTLMDKENSRYDKKHAKMTGRGSEGKTEKIEAKDESNIDGQSGEEE